MKRHWTITLILCLAAVATLLAIRYWPHAVDDEGCSDLYRLYAGQEGIEATFISQMQMNDTLRVDLTLLQATSEAGWQRLSEDFEVPPIADEEQALMDDENPEILLSILTPLPADTLDIAVTARQMKCVSVFHVCNEAQFNAIVDKHIDQLMK